MTTLGNLVQTPLAKAIGLTLFHSLWEGAGIAIVLFAVLCVTRTSRLRYAGGCAAMLAILAGFAFTLARAMPETAGAALTVTRAIPSAASGRGLLLPGVAQWNVADVLPWLAPVWIAGVIFFQLRNVVSWMSARRLRRSGVCCAPEAWQRELARLRERLRMSKPVALLETCLSDVPVVIGYLRPVILVPIGMLTGMPATRIEAILLHELAHIRRHDYLVNLVQTAGECFLFYHPAVWWIAGVIRTERENCCDDVVVATSGNAYEYAAALAALEENRRAADEVVLAANGGSLVKRIHRLLYPRESPRAVPMPLFSAGILTITAAVALTAWQAKPADLRRVAQVRQEAQAGRGPLADPYLTWLDMDAAYIITDPERNAFLLLTSDEERGKFIEQFWLRRDPTPGTAENEYKTEHYRRMARANARFTSRIPGWKSDRGRIYIQHGPPDEIDSHPSGGSGTIATWPYEDWRYRYIDGMGSNVDFEFVDTAASGEYRMTTDLAEKNKTP